MPQARAGSLSPRRRKRSRRGWDPLLRAIRRRRRQAQANWRRATWPLRLGVGAIVLIAVWAPLNIAYQVIRKPSELLAPFSDLLLKTPPETWHDYAPLFRRYATATITPELLAALAQVESAGDPVATTYWHWRFSVNPFAIYRPASSSVGMFQMTDGAFAEARNYCVHDHHLATDCTHGLFYSRVFPGDAIELTVAYLDRKLSAILGKYRHGTVTPQQRDHLAAMIHLCGTGPAEEYAQRGFRLAPGKHCGDQDVAAYLARVAGVERRFLELAKAE
jgi:hypothetical protein